MRKPLIGVTALIDYGRESLWMLPEYFEGVGEAGGIPVMLPVTGGREEIAQLLEAVDGVLIAGGQDVDPGVYHEAPLSVCGEVSPERDAMEGPLLDAALLAGVPVLGICRGIQFLNAHLGGTLWQDLPAQRPSEVCHRQKPPYDAPAHEVRILPDTPLWEIFRTESMPVNSLHHQAIRELAPALRPMAVSEDGLVEAAYLPDRPYVWAVQWHPEYSHKVDVNARRIFTAFVRSCENRMNNRQK